MQKLIFWNKIRLFVGAHVLILFLAACSSDDGGDSPISMQEPPNILLIIADDLGKDAIRGFSEGNIKANTPTLDSIRNAGMIFNNLWSYPTCTPTRASIITGKYGYNSQVKWVGDELSSSETILQKYIKDQSSNQYATAVIGKWHLAGNNSAFNPETLGLDHYSGLIRGAADDYYNWQLTEDGSTSLVSEYITTYFTDRSIEWIGAQTEPWFLWLAYTAPHTPFHAPPVEMHSQGDLPEYEESADPLPYYLAAVEAMDFQINKLLSSIPNAELDNTVILFLGDNGTPSGAAQSPYTFGKVKATLYQGGINVPLFISGANVSRTGSDDNLITSSDLFATIAEITGIDVQEINDSKSFKSLFLQSSSIRDFQYSERNDGTIDSWAIRDKQYKLIADTEGNEELYDLLNDPYENNDLLNGNLSPEQDNAKTILEQEVQRIRN